MPAAEARIETGRASRYLTQLCRHVQGSYSKRGHAQGRPSQPPHVEWTETQGTISAGDTVITVRADPGALVLRAEADSEDSLRHAQELVTGLLARFGRRDQLSVTWQ